MEIQVKNLDHLGIVAGIVDQIGLVEEIDRLIKPHPQQIISTGQVVKAVILNGLGFVSAPSSRIPLRLTATRGRSFIFI